MSKGRKLKIADVMLCKEGDKRNPYPDFNWWHATAQPKTVKIVRKDALPIPRLHDRYRYRYSSAGPCSVGRTAKEKATYRVNYKLVPKVTIEDKLDLKMINQTRGYETTSMTASLQPFRSVGDFITTSSAIPADLNEPLNIPYQTHSKFEKYVVEMLHPNWKKDPLFRRVVKFSFQDSPEDAGPTEVSRR